MHDRITSGRVHMESRAEDSMSRKNYFPTVRNITSTPNLATLTKNFDYEYKNRPDIGREEYLRATPQLSNIRLTNSEIKRA